MTVLDCAEVREVAPELALNVLSGAERANALNHMSDCAACRSHLRELTEAVDAVPLLVAEAQPPPGFQQRVVQQMTTPSRRFRRRWPAALVAAAAAAILVTTAGFLVQGRGSQTRAASAGHQIQPAPGDVRSTTMVGAGGERVGRLFTTRSDPALMMVAVDYAVPSGTYTVEQQISDGTSRRLGQMQVSNGHGTWGGITAAHDRHGSVELIDSRGAVLCQAPLTATQ